MSEITGERSQDVQAYVDRALELHAAGYNCAQSVACALNDLTDADEATLFKLMEGFGAGMGNFSETCGAISGGVALIGCVNSAGIEVRKSKGSTYKVTKGLVQAFKDKNGSTLCGEIKGLTTPERTVLRSCDGCIEDAVEMTYGILKGLSEKA